MALSEILGQDRPLAILRRCIESGRVPHSLLFTGDEGIGKHLTAVNFAKVLNCRSSEQAAAAAGDLFFPGQNRDAPADPARTPVDACDHCPSCSKIDQGIHPDVFMLAPEGDGGQITVAAIRKLEESLSYKPFEGAWKIAIIDSADRLNASAANAFLQTLEEPSSRSMFILITARPDLILATIRSRCQRIHFSPLPAEEMSRLLSERFGQDSQDRADLLSTLSGGRLGQALGDDLVEQRDRFVAVFRSMLECRDDELWEDRESMEAWLEWSQLLLRDMAVYRSTGQDELLINRDLARDIASLSQGADLKRILTLARDLYTIKQKIIYNLNRQLTFNYVSLLLRKNLVQGRE